MSTYYVSSSTGSDSTGTGSSGAPWATFTHALANSVANDTILGKGGDTFAAEPAYPINVTTTTGYRTFGSYGTGNATIAGGSALRVLVSTNVGMTVENLTLTANTVDTYDGTRYGIVQYYANDNLTHTDGLTVTNCTVSGGYGGILVQAAAGTKIFNCPITNCTIFNTTYIGVHIVASVTSATTVYSNIQVTGCTIHDVTGAPSTYVTGSGVVFGNCGSDAAQCTIENNHVYSCGYNSAVTSGSAGGPAGIFPVYSSGVLMRGNVIHDIYYGTLGVDGDGLDIDIDCDDCVAEYNVVYNCQGAGMAFYSPAGFTGNIFRFNLCVNVSTGTQGNMGGIAACAEGNCTWHNNTVIALNNAAVYFQSVNSMNKVLYNNLLICPTGQEVVISDYALDPTCRMDGNCYQVGGFDAGSPIFYAKLAANYYTTLASYQAATGVDTHSLVGSCSNFLAPTPIPAITPATIASLAANYAVHSTSPMAYAGMDLLSVFDLNPGSQDLLGTSLAVPYSIGAIAVPVAPASYYQQQVLADGPTVWARLNEASGTILYDAIFGAGQGTYTSCTLGQTSLLANDPGTCVAFNGTSSYAAFPAASFNKPFTLTQMTVEGWFYPTSLPSETAHWISNYYQTGAYDSFYVGVSTNVPRFSLVDLNGPKTLVANATSFTLSTNTLYHVVWVWGGGNTITLYVNGAEQAVTTPTVGTPLGFVLSNLYIGAGNKGTTFSFDGKMSDVTIYREILSGARVLAHYNAGIAAHAESVIGPARSTVGTASSDFTITPNGSLSDTVTMTSSVGGDTITPSTLTWSSSSAARTFTVTPSTAGPREISLASGNSYVVVASPLAFSGLQTYTVTGATTLLVGEAVTFTITPASSTTDTVTLSDGNRGGTFTPTTLSWSSSGSGQTVSYTAATVGSTGISVYSTVNGAVAGSLAVTAYALAIDAYLAKSGKLFVIGANSSNQIQNGVYLPAAITAVSANPTIEVNGDTVSIGPPTWMNSSQDSPFVSYLAQCGGVESLNVSNGGTTAYTSPTVAWNNDGGGTGLTLGTPVLATGVISYTITSYGSGYDTSFAITVPGGSKSIAATAWVTVVAGAVTAVTPLTGSSLAYGTGYAASFTGAVLDGSSSLVVGGAGGSLVWEVIGYATGTGLTVSCTVGKYIQSVPVTAAGSGFTSPPTFTISDSTGAGAVLVPVMTGPASTDTLTYSLAAGALTATVNATTGLFSPPVAAGTSMTNSATATEGTIGRMIGFGQTPTLGLGFNFGSSCTPLELPTFTGKNKLKCGTGFEGFFGSPQISLDSNFYPAYWTPSTVIGAQFWQPYGQGYTAPFYSGTWTLQYDDDFYSGGLSHPSYAKIGQNVGTNLADLPVIAASYTTLPTAGSVTISSGKITAIAVAGGGSGITAAVVSITGGVSNNGYACAVANITSGSVSSITILSGGQNYSSSTPPTVTITPVTVSGNTVTIGYTIDLSNPNTGGGVYLDMVLVSGSDGTQHVHNPWAFAPNNTIDRSKPYATDDNVVVALSSGGLGPAIVRFMGPLVNAISPNVIDPSDLLDPDWYNWNIYFNNNFTFPGGPPNSPTFSGTCASGQNTITGIASTASLQVGQPIVGLGIPGTITPNSPNQTRITAINSSTEITISNNAFASGAQTLSVNPTPSGSILWSYARRYFTDPAQSGISWTPSGKIYSSENWAISGTDGLGPYFTVTNGPLGATDNGNYITGGTGTYASGLVELRSLLPHGLRSGMISNDQGYGEFYPTFGFTGTTTSGSATITGISSTSILHAGQFVSGAGIPSGASIVSVAANSVTISADATASGTISVTVSNGIPWANTGKSLALNVAPSYIANVLFVTGPYTAVFIVSTGGSGGTTYDWVNSTSEIPIYLQYFVTAPVMNVPYEYCAAMAAYWSNTVLHLNLPWCCSDATVQSIAQRVSANIGATNDIVIEVGNEPWNNGYESQWNGAVGYLTRGMPVGTEIFPHYTNTGSTTSYATNTTGFSDPTKCQTLRDASRHYVFCQEWSALGNDVSRVKLGYSCQPGNLGNPGDIIKATQIYDLPQQYMMLAPYVNLPTDSSFTVACLPAGYAAYGSPGNWPVDAINDWVRHYIRYAGKYRSQWAGMAGELEGTTFQLLGYEGCPAENVAWSALSGLEYVPFYDQVSQDCFYHPSYTDVLWSYWLFCQTGDPNIAGSGEVLHDYFNYATNKSVGTTWKLCDGPSQPINAGDSNQFVTPQGGAPGTGNPNGYFQTNAAPGVFIYEAWIGALSDTLTSGIATLGSVTTTTIAASSTAASSGTSPYAYQWQISTDGAIWASASGTGVTTLSMTATGLTEGVTYYFRLQTTDSAAAVVYSDVVSATTVVIGALVSGTASLGTVGATTIAATATAATSGTSPYTYQWQISTDNATWTSATGTGTTSLSLTATGLSEGISYYLRVESTDSAASIVYSNVVSATTSIVLAGGATLLTLGSTTIQVTAYPASGGASPYSYQWEQSTDDATWTDAAGTGVTTLTAQITGLTASTTYYVRVEAVDANDVAAYSNEIVATTSSGAVTSSKLTRSWFPGLSHLNRIGY